MKKIGVIPNFEKDPEFKDTKKILKYIKSIGAMPLLTAFAANMTDMPESAVDEDELFKSSDFIVVLGGDGTLLEAAERASLYGTPILGINFGTMGFLTDSERTGAEESIRLAVEGKCVIEKRIMLKGTVCKADGNK